VARTLYHKGSIKWRFRKFPFLHSDLYSCLWPTLHKISTHFPYLFTELSQVVSPHKIVRETKFAGKLLSTPTLVPNKQTNKQNVCMYIYIYIYAHLTILHYGSYRPEREFEQFCAETITCDEGTNSSACNTDLLYCAVGRYTNTTRFSNQSITCLSFYLITCWISEQTSLYSYLLWNNWLGFDSWQGFVSSSALPGLLLDGTCLLSSGYQRLFARK
jgi:hypothetical protein